MYEGHTGKDRSGVCFYFCLGVCLCSCVCSCESADDQLIAIKLMLEL